jgi:hypothetical protein
MIFGHLYNYGMTSCFFIFQNGWLLHFDLCKYVITYTILYMFLVLKKYVNIYTISQYIWFCTNMLTKNLSFKTQFHFICLNQTMIPFISKLFKTNLNIFCGFGCIRRKTSKCFMKLKYNKAITKNLALQIGNWFY